ncbi:MAG: hypothetical protein ACKVOH_05615 [Chlamydiales bacterium]
MTTFIQIGERYWQVNQDGHIQATASPQGQAVVDLSSAHSADVNIILNRRKGECFYVKGDRLHRTSRCISWIRGTDRVQEIVQRALGELVAAANLANAPAVSHLLHRHFRPEGNVGRLDRKIPSIAAVGGAAYAARDQMAAGLFVDIVVGEERWRVNRATKQIAPIETSADGIPVVDLSGDSNRLLIALFRGQKRPEIKEYLKTKLRLVADHKEEIAILINILCKGDDCAEYLAALHHDTCVEIQMGENCWQVDTVAQNILQRSVRVGVRVVDLSGNGLYHQNFLRLLEHKQGESLIAKEGRLSVVATMAERWRCFWHRKEEQRKVQEVVSATLRELEQRLAGHQVEALRLFLRRQFQGNGPIARLGREIYDRGCVAERGNIERMLESNLVPRRDALITALMEVNRLKGIGAMEDQIAEAEDTAAMALHDLEFEEMRFAYSLGEDLKFVTKGGSGGARLGFSRWRQIAVPTAAGAVTMKDAPVQVAKPGDEGPYGKNNPQKGIVASFKRAFVGIRPCLRGNSEPLSEVGARVVSEGERYKIVPPTSVRIIESKTFIGHSRKECSFQSFIFGCQTLRDILGISDFQRDWRRDRLQEEMADPSSASPKGERLARLGITSGLIGNLGTHNFDLGDTDGHWENFFWMRKTIEHPTIRAIFTGAPIERAVVEEMVATMFTHHTHYQLHQAFFCAENDVILVKHDGGSGLVNKHPTTNFEVRLAYLFKDMPQMREQFPVPVQQLFQDNHRFFRTQLRLGGLYISNFVEKHIFARFWASPVNRDLMKTWILGADNTAALAQALAAGHRAGIPAAAQEAVLESYTAFYQEKLLHLRGILSTRQERWQLEKAFVQTASPMRELFACKKQREIQQKHRELWQGDMVDTFDRELQLFSGRAAGATAIDFDQMGNNDYLNSYRRLAQEMEGA